MSEAGRNLVLKKGLKMPEEHPGNFRAFGGQELSRQVQRPGSKTNAKKCFTARIRILAIDKANYQRTTVIHQYMHVIYSKDQLSGHH